ncbi:MAG: translocation/assembly module TamB domain-containing protein [Halioglobus sp.]
MKPGLLVLGSLLALVTAMAVLVALPFTAAGSRLLVVALDNATELEIEYRAGTLLGQLSLANVVVPTDSAIVSLIDVRAELATSCLWRAAICLNQLTVASLDVMLPSQTEEAVDPDEATPFWPLPFEVSSEKFVIDQLHVHWDSGELRGRALKAAAVVAGARVQVGDATASDVWLRVPDSEHEPVNARSEMPDVDMPLELVVGSLVLEDSGWIIGDLRNAYEELALRGQWQGTKLSLSDLKVSNPEWGGAQLQGAMDFRHPYKVDVTGQFAAADPPLWGGLKQASAELKLSGDLASLQVDLLLCAELGIRVQGQWDLVSAGLPMDLQARSGCENHRGPLVLAQLLEMESLSGVLVEDNWALGIKGDTRSQWLELGASVSVPEQDKLQLHISAEHVPGELRVAKLQVTADPKQSLQLQGDLYYGDQFSWELAATLTSFQLPSVVSPLAGELSGSFQVEGFYAGDSWRLALPRSLLQGEINQRQATISGNFQLDHELQSDGSDLDIRVGTDRIRLFDPPEALPQARFAISDLAHWLEGGSGSVEGSLFWDRVGSELSMDARSAGLAWGVLRTGELFASGSLNSRSGIAGELQLSAAHTLVGDTRLESVQFVLAGTEQAHSLSLETAGDVAASLRVMGSLIEGDWTGRLAPAVVQVTTDNWALEDTLPLHYASDKGQLSFADHCWQSSSAQVCARGAKLGYSGELELDLSGSLADVQSLLPARYSLLGDVDGQLRARWVDLHPKLVALTLEVGAGRVEESLLGEGRARFAWDAITLNYSGNPQVGELRGVVQRFGQEQFALDLAMPASLDGELAGKLTIDSLALEDLRPFTSSLNRLQGSMDGALLFSGRVGEPKVKGSLSLAEVRASIAGNPTEIDGGSLDLDFLGDKAEISGELFVGEGRSDIEGQLQWLPEPALQISLRGDKKPFLYPADTIVYAAEDLLLKMDAQGVKLTGNVDVLEGQIVLEDLPASAVEVSDDVVLLDYTGSESQQPPAGRVELELDVQISDQLGFSADGIEGRVGGNLTLLKLGNEPLRLLGKLNVREGHFDLLGPRFEVTRGQMAFVGAPANPQLDIAMEREVTEDQVTVGIRVTGNLQVPRLEFYSRPALPEAEVMAYALGGRGIDRSGEGDGLALALAMTSGLMQSNDLLSGFSLGVEGKNTSTRAVIGGYVSEKIYLSYGVGLYEPVNTLTVRLDILHNFWAEVVSSLRSSADVYYSWSSR